MKISVIMPYRRDGGPREKIFNWIAKRYSLLFPQFELCLAEDNEPVFYKTKAVNQAAKKAHGYIFILADADIFFNSQIILKALEKIDSDNLSWVMPYIDYLPLSANQTEKMLIIKPDKEIKIMDKQVKGVRRNCPAGLIMITKEAFFDIGGYDERFKGWGCEDTAFYITANTLLHPAIRLPEKIYHLWHPKEKGRSLNAGTFERNANLRAIYQSKANEGKESLSKYIKEG
jgi:predicted glycosyltransferase involved in capsule biosynthesis